MNYACPYNIKNNFLELLITVYRAEAIPFGSFEQ